MTQLSEEFFDKLRKDIQIYFKGGTGHGFDHVRRVYANALLISNEENADLDIVRAATLLHDVARAREKIEGVDCHAEEGSIMCRGILKEAGFPEEKIEAVSYAIKVHRYSSGIMPETTEAKILQDADRLDAIGAIVIGRIFEFAGEMKISLYDPDEDTTAEYKSDDKDSCIGHLHRKALKITPDKFHTNKAKEIAKSRHNFVKEFADRYVKEWNGEL